ncbi:hypothetical protein GOP47_0024176 [Adiantum capillus-veneris]|uniref:Uncharacterized protein n=1 Tax=Adiantum capillus-veneris TaxID=13818 RepID=A0A9D4U4Y5_ADICA|nr:hypothetical protein GOP47_0024176 [Adiantum capillus-veneris]
MQDTTKCNLLWYAQNMFDAFGLQMPFLGLNLLHGAGKKTLEQESFALQVILAKGPNFDHGQNIRHILSRSKPAINFVRTRPLRFFCEHPHCMHTVLQTPQCIHSVA